MWTAIMKSSRCLLCFTNRKGVSNMKFKEFLLKYKHAIFILYLPFYMTWFVALEQRTNVKFTDIHCIVDDWIPFCEAFIIPYLLWFLYVAAGLVFLFFQLDHLEDFYHCVIMLILGMTAFLIISTVFPNGQSMRPTTFDRDNIFTRIIAVLYSTDTSTNVFPSIHVYNSIVIHAGLANVLLARNKRGWYYASLVLCISICLSTVFLKQHSFLDGVAAIGLFLICKYMIWQVQSLRRHTHESALVETKTKPSA